MVAARRLIVEERERLPAGERRAWIQRRVEVVRGHAGAERVERGEKRGVDHAGAVVGHARG